MKHSQFSNRLFDTRRAKGFTQQQMADSIKVARQTYLDMESGMTTPRLDKVEELASVLGVKPEYLAYGVVVPMSSDELKAENLRLSKMVVDIGRIVAAKF